MACKKFFYAKSRLTRRSLLAGAGACAAAALSTRYVLAQPVAPVALENYQRGLFQCRGMGLPLSWPKRRVLSRRKAMGLVRLRQEFLFLLTGSLPRHGAGVNTLVSRRPF